MKYERVLVTGGAGFIGSNLANCLAEDNDVIALDDTCLGTPENLVDDSPVDVLFYLAALPSRNMHESNPQRGCRVNVEGFVNSVERARKPSSSRKFRTRRHPATASSTPTSTARSPRSSRSRTTRRATS